MCVTANKHFLGLLNSNICTQEHPATCSISSPFKQTNKKASYLQNGFVEIKLMRIWENTEKNYTMKKTHSGKIINSSVVLFQIP